MPHQCTTCGHSFEDGSKEMLGGCPDCGGNTFQFYPEGTDVPDEPPDDAEAEPPGEPEPSVSSTVGRATTKVRDFVSGGTPGGTDADAVWPEEDPSASSGDTDIIDADARATERAVEDAEDAAQASARTDIATEREVEAGTSDEPSAGGGSPVDGDEAPSADGSLADAEGRVVSAPTGEEPDIRELREQLDAQFESIKILEPGQYELNLMELYDREEYIIALQENGRYVIQVPEQWMGDRAED